MRVLIVIDGMNIGGAETMIMNINRIRDKNVMDFDFFLNQKVNYFESEILSYNQKIYFTSPKSRNLIKYCFDLYKTIKDNKYEIIHIHASTGSALIPVLVSKLCRVRKIILHSHNSSGGNKYFQKVYSIILNKIVKDKLACSISAGEWMYGRRSKFQVIDNPINVLQFKYNDKDRFDIRKLLNINDNTIVFVHVGRFTKQKNHLKLIDIYKTIVEKHSDSRLILVGTGELFDEVKLYTKNCYLDDKVIFLGARNDIFKILSASDFFLMPSLYEGFPLTLIEAQANGLRCVISNTISREVCETDLIMFADNSEIQEWINNIDNNIDNSKRYLYNNTIYSKYDAKITYHRLMSIYLEER